MTEPVIRRVGKEEIERRLRAGLMVGTGAWGALVAQRSKARAPVKSGRLARSIHVGNVVQAGDIAYRIDVGTDVEYARAVEEGSGLFSIHPQFRRLILIEPRYRRALAFAWPGAPSGAPGFSKKTGKYVFKRVWHPGVKPRPFLRPAARESRPEGHVLVISAIRAELVR